MLAALDTEVRRHGLCLRGALHLRNDPAWGNGTVALLGPDEPGFWKVFAASAEHSAGGSDPLDRWSKRVIGALAKAHGARAVFPSDGPPYPPFLAWARDSGQAFESPVGLLVHAEAGLLVSYRGALILPERYDLPARSISPCETCTGKPCLTACPVGALGAGQSYDVPSCAAHVREDGAATCGQSGCLVRRACPLSEEMKRPDAQAQFHMNAFLGSRL